MFFARLSVPRYFAKECCSPTSWGITQDRENLQRRHVRMATKVLPIIGSVATARQINRLISLLNLAVTGLT